MIDRRTRREVPDLGSERWALAAADDPRKTSRVLHHLKKWNGMYAVAMTTNNMSYAKTETAEMHKGD